SLGQTAQSVANVCLIEVAALVSDRVVAVILVGMPVLILSVARLDAGVGRVRKRATVGVGPVGHQKSLQRRAVRGTTRAVLEAHSPLMEKNSRSGRVQFCAECSTPGQA